jgi:hypothetical protein
MTILYPYLIFLEFFLEIHFLGVRSISYFFPSFAAARGFTSCGLLHIVGQNMVFYGHTDYQHLTT